MQKAWARASLRIASTSVAPIAHRLDQRGTDGQSQLLEPHRAPVDADAESLESIFLSIQRQPIAQLVSRDVREHRRRGKRTRNQCARTLHRGDHRVVTVADLVLHTCDDEADRARTPPGHLEAVLGADAWRGAFERRIRQLDPLLGHVQLGQAAATGRLVLRLLSLPPPRLRIVVGSTRRCVRSDRRRLGRVVETGESVELAKLPCDAVQPSLGRARAQLHA